MKFSSARELMRALIDASDEDQRRIIWSMTPADLLALDADFEAWAHKAQLPPTEEGWRTWLMMAGRGFGKTRAGAEWVEKIARSRTETAARQFRSLLRQLIASDIGAGEDIDQELQAVLAVL